MRLEYPDESMRKKILGTVAFVGEMAVGAAAVGAVAVVVSLFIAREALRKAGACLSSTLSSLED